MLTPTDSFRLYIVDERTGKRRLTRFAMTREQAAEGYPGAEPNLHTREVRNLPEPGEMRANTKPPDAPTTPVDLSSCAFCEGSGWVCSDHPSLPFEPSAPQSSCSPCLCNPNAALRWHATCPAVTH